jgi:hypothetical protein
VTTRARRKAPAVLVAAGVLSATATVLAPAQAEATPRHLAPASVAAAGPQPKQDASAVAGPSSSTASVAVIRPTAGDPVLEEASLRIRSELGAVGTSSRLVDCPPAAERASCGESSSAARIALGREDGIATIQVTASLPDGLELRRHVRVPPEAGGEDPSVLAVRAVELLRDIYIDIPRVARRSPSGAASARAPVAKEGAPAPANGSTVAGRALVGVGLLQGRWGLGAAPAPVFGFGVSFLSRLALLATVAGPFHKTIGSVVEGAIDTWQTLGALQLRYEIGFTYLRPYASAGVGAFSLRVQGHPETAPGMTTAITPSKVAPLVAVGAGVMIPIARWLAFTLDVQEIVTWPVLDVTSSGMVLGRAGGPSDLVQAGLVLMRP